MRNTEFLWLKEIIFIAVCFTIGLMLENLGYSGIWGPLFGISLVICLGLNNIIILIEWGRNR